MDRLPAEIFLQVLEYLPVDALKQARQACRAFSQAISPLLFERVHFAWCRRDSADELHDLSSFALAPASALVSTLSITPCHGCYKDWTGASCRVDRLARIVPHSAVTTRDLTAALQLFLRRIHTLEYGRAPFSKSFWTTHGQPGLDAATYWATPHAHFFPLLAQARATLSTLSLRGVCLDSFRRSQPGAGALRFHTLTHLSFSAPAWPNDVVVFMLANATTLRVLRLFCCALTKEGWSALLAYLPAVCGLEYFSIVDVAVPESLLTAATRPIGDYLPPGTLGRPDDLGRYSEYGWGVGWRRR